jgi:hypothetical protein
MSDGRNPIETIQLRVKYAPELSGGVDGASFSELKPRIRAFLSSHLEFPDGYECGVFVNANESLKDANREYTIDLKYIHTRGNPVSESALLGLDVVCTTWTEYGKPGYRYTGHSSVAFSELMRMAAGKYGRRLMLMDPYDSKHPMDKGSIEITSVRCSAFPPVDALSSPSLPPSSSIARIPTQSVESSDAIHSLIKRGLHLYYHGYTPTWDPVRLIHNPYYQGRVTMNVGCAYALSTPCRDTFTGVFEGLLRIALARNGVSAKWFAATCSKQMESMAATPNPAFYLACAVVGEAMCIVPNACFYARDVVNECRTYPFSDGVKDADRYTNLRNTMSDDCEGFSLETMTEIREMRRNKREGSEALRYAAWILSLYVPMMCQLVARSTSAKSFVHPGPTIGVGGYQNVGKRNASRRFSHLHLDVGGDEDSVSHSACIADPRVTFRRRLGMSPIADAYPWESKIPPMMLEGTGYVYPQLTPLPILMGAAGNAMSAYMERREMVQRAFEGRHQRVMALEAMKWPENTSNSVEDLASLMDHRKQLGKFYVAAVSAYVPDCFKEISVGEIAFVYESQKTYAVSMEDLMLPGDDDPVRYVPCAVFTDKEKKLILDINAQDIPIPDICTPEPTPEHAGEWRFSKERGASVRFVKREEDAVNSFRLPKGFMADATDPIWITYHIRAEDFDSEKLQDGLMEILLNEGVNAMGYNARWSNIGVIEGHQLNVMDFSFVLSQ